MRKMRRRERGDMADNQVAAPVAQDESSREGKIFTKIAWRLLPLLFVGYFFAYLDRINVGFAKLQMASELNYSDAVYGFGAGIFFIGYFLFEVPSNLVLAKVGARRWIARIMITWGLISTGFVFAGDLPWGPVSEAFGLTDAEFSFYALRFLLGVAEAGFYPGVILYLTFWFPERRRAFAISLFMTAIAFSGVFGSPLSGAIMQYFDGVGAVSGWQWLFILEGLPTVLLGLLFLAILPDGPRTARWLTPNEREVVESRLERDRAATPAHKIHHRVSQAFKDVRVWTLSIAYLLSATAFYAVIFWMPTLVEESGIDPGDYMVVGLLTMIPWSVAAVVMVLWARHSDRTGERRWHTGLPLLFSALGLVLLALGGEDPFVAISGLSLVAGGCLSSIVVFWSLTATFLSGMAAAGGIAMINSIGNLGGHFGPDLIGRIREANAGDSTAAFLVLAVGTVLGAVLAYMAPAMGRQTSASS